MRRTLIQYFSDYATRRKRVKELEELSAAFVHQASAGVIGSKVVMPITERVIQDKPDIPAMRHRIQLQLERNYLNKALAEYTGTQAIIAQMSQFADDSIGLINRLDGEQADDDDYLLLASVL